MRTIQSLRLDGLLSFAPGSPAFDLGALNVLIPGNSPIGCSSTSSATCGGWANWERTRERRRDHLEGGGEGKNPQAARPAADAHGGLR